MDPVGLDSVDSSVVEFENLVSSVGEKRVAESDDLVGNKKARIDLDGDMKRVAEIVMVLSVMGNMRGGKSPSAVEKELMAEAREKLAGMCEGMTPKDVVPRDAVRVVIEDLGLNRSRDQRLSFRPPRMSIAEKLQLTMRKAEESKKFATQSATFSSQRLQAGFGARLENHGPSLHAAHRFQPNKPSPNVSAGGHGIDSPMVHVSALPASTSSNPLHSNEVQSAMVSKGLLNRPLERDLSSLSSPQMEAVHFRSDGRSNGPPYASQSRANSSGDHLLEKAPTCSPQLQSGVAKVGQANKAAEKVEGKSEISTSQVTLQATRDWNLKPSVAQIASGNLPSATQPFQALNFGQTSPLYTNHNEISKSVHKFLQPRPPDHPNWTPPSTDYMSKSLTCQICKITVNDVESLLVCDACEKGVHLKCLQSYNQKGIPKGEWHCPKCLISSNGKPLPPKYGRVTRSISAPKVSPNTGGVQASSEKVENLDSKVNHQKITANGNPGSLHLAHVGRSNRNHIDLVSDLKISNTREVQGANFSASKMKMDDSPLSELKPLPKETLGVVCVPPVSDTPNESSKQQFQNSESSPCGPEGSILESTSLPMFEPGHFCPDKSFNTTMDACRSSYALGNSQDINNAALPTCAEVFANPHHEVKTSVLKETSECKPSCNVRKDDQDVAHTVSAGTLDITNGTRDGIGSSLDGLYDVNWVGDRLQLVDEKAFYRSCQINGMVYKVQDHALFRSNNGNLRPSKLQALWEDTKTGSKWAIVNMCYFPGDLPEVVGRPCTPENKEVYESNHGSTVMAGLIQGPCEVLPLNKFKVESERQIRLRHEANDGLQPVFLCKWFYDESKGLFRSVSD